MTPPHLLSIRKVQSRPQDSSVRTSVNGAELWTPRTTHRQCKSVRGTPELGPGCWGGRVLLGLLCLLRTTHRHLETELRFTTRP